jgi:hypothetical protein
MPWMRPFRQAAVKASYSLSYSALDDGRLMACRQAAELVGVAGFEPAASSSRSNSAMSWLVCLSRPGSLSSAQTCWLSRGESWAVRTLAPFLAPLAIRGGEVAHGTED